MQTCLCILQGYRYLFVAIILNVPETQFLHCPILFCVIFIIIFCSKCLINWVKSCIYFAYWLIQATHYLPVDCIILLWNWCRCLNLGAFTHKLHTCLNLGRCMAFVNTLLPQTNCELWKCELIFVQSAVHFKSNNKCEPTLWEWLWNNCLPRWIWNTLVRTPPTVRYVLTTKKWQFCIHEYFKG